MKLNSIKFVLKNKNVGEEDLCRSQERDIIKSDVNVSNPVQLTFVLATCTYTIKLLKVRFQVNITICK